MEETTTAPQSAPQGEPAPQPATDTAPATGTEQTPQTESQAQPTPSAEGTQPQGEKPKQTPWFQRRIDDLTREKWDERRRADALQAALESALGRTQTPPADGQPTATQPDATAAKPLSQSDIDRLAEQKAQQIANQRAFNDACNRAYDTGKNAFPDFDDALRNLGMLGAVGQNASPAFLEAATALPDAHQVLYHLGKNPDEAARIVSLSPVQMAAELGRLSASVGRQTKPVSAAPAPIKPIDGSARGEPDPEKMSMDDFIKWREKNARRR